MLQMFYHKNIHIFAAFQSSNYLMNKSLCIRCGSDDYDGMIAIAISLSREDDNLLRFPYGKGWVYIGFFIFFKNKKTKQITNNLPYKQWNLIMNYFNNDELKGDHHTTKIDNEKQIVLLFFFFCYKYYTYLSWTCVDLFKSIELQLNQEFEWKINRIIFWFIFYRSKPIKSCAIFYILRFQSWPIKVYSKRKETQQNKKKILAFN